MKDTPGANKETYSPVLDIPRSGTASFATGSVKMSELSSINEYKSAKRPRAGESSSGPCLTHMSEFKVPISGFPGRPRTAKTSVPRTKRERKYEYLFITLQFFRRNSHFPEI